MRHGQPLRLFVAVYPPLEVAQQLLALLPGLNLPPHRPTRPDQVHMTLVFIGDTPPRELRAVTESVERSCAGLSAFEIITGGLVTIPDQPPAPPRLIALETGSPPGLMEIQRRLATRLAKPRKSRKPDRFRPHLTLARFPEGTRGGPWAAAAPALVFPVARVDLVASTLHAAGAEHRTIASVPLKADG